MRLQLVLGLSALAAVTCQRVEEPSPPATSPPPAETSMPTATSTGTSADAGSAPPDAARCITPLADPPPAPAEPAPTCPADPVSAPAPLAHGKVVFPEATAAPTVDVEIADTPATEQRGLMYRTKLGAMSGMIFVWEEESPRTFWMRNTCLPLDMLFLAKDGTVVGILEQVPVLNDRPRGVGCAAAYVLEVNAGWTRAHGVKPGMKADLTL